MSFEVHREPLYRRYFGSYCSGACCYFIIIAVIIVFLPLVIAYNTSMFWLKEVIVYEQPSVSYRYQSIFQLHGQRDGRRINLFYSTNPQINRLYQKNFRMPIFRSMEFDDNRDGRTDRIEIGLQMPLQPNEDIHAISSLSYFDFQFSEYSKILFDTVSYVDHEGSTSIGQVNIDGDLVLRQTWPFVAKGGFRLPYSENPLISTELLEGTNGGVASAEDVSVANLLKMSASRNESIKFSPNYIHVERRGIEIESLESSLRYFNASIVLHIPSQPIRYTPDVSAVLKHAWIQYVAFLIPIAFILLRINSFIFRHKLLSVYTSADIVYEKVD